MFHRTRSISAFSSGSDSGERVTADPISHWLSVLAPEGSPAVAKAIETLPLRPVYADGDSPVGQRPWCAEWSIRSEAEHVDTGRVMVAVDTSRCRPGQISAALNSLGGASTRLQTLAEALLKERPDLDLLLGFATNETPPRAKLYVLRPAGRPIAGFGQLSEDILRLSGVHPGWVQTQMAKAEGPPAFLAIDIRSDGSAAGKLYFSFNNPADTDDLLDRFDASLLRTKLKEVSPLISSNPTGRFVVTTRGSGSETVDITLHAHVTSLPTLDQRLVTRWQEIKTLAQRQGPLPVTHSYVSWMQGERPSESLYYTFTPQP